MKPAHFLLTIPLLFVLGLYVRVLDAVVAIGKSVRWLTTNS